MTLSTLATKIPSYDEHGARAPMDVFGLARLMRDLEIDSAWGLHSHEIAGTERVYGPRRVVEVSVHSHSHSGWHLHADEET